MKGRKNLSILFTARQLIKNYMHVGVNFRNVNRNNSYLIAGIYNNVSVINLSRVVPILKKRFFFFFRFMTLNFSRVLMANGLSINKADSLISKLNFLHIDYFFGRWWNGFIKNYKVFTKARTTYENNISVPYFPHFIFFIPFNDNYNDVSAYAAGSEFQSVGVHSIVFFDSHKDYKYVKTGVMLNTKTILNNFFLSSLLFSVQFKLSLVKKKKFYYSVMRRLKVRVKKKTPKYILRLGRRGVKKHYYTKVFNLNNMLSFLFNNSYMTKNHFKYVFFQYDRFVKKKYAFRDFYKINKIFFKAWKDFLK